MVGRAIAKQPKGMGHSHCPVKHCPSTTNLPRDMHNCGLIPGAEVCLPQPRPQLHVCNTWVGRC